jgi:hypothetical protein
MFTDLAFIDWIALIFAAVLLSAAAAAAVIAYASARARPASAVTAAPQRQTPAHAAPSRWLSHATPPSRWSSSDVVVETKTVSRVPDPPILKPKSMPTSAVENDEVDIDLRVVTAAEESLALRAAKLRGRPIPETTPIAKSVGAEQVEEDVALVHVSRLAMVGGVPSSSDSANNGRVAGFAARSPGFFEDPAGRHELRYWDGHQWTEYVKERGERFTDPL